MNYYGQRVVDYLGEISLMTTAPKERYDKNVVPGRLAGDGKAIDSLIAGDVELGANSCMVSCVVGEGVKLRVAGNTVLNACAFLSGDIAIGANCKLGAVFADALKRFEVGNDSCLANMDLRMKDSVLLLGAGAHMANVQITTDNSHISVGRNATVFRYKIAYANDTPEQERIKPLLVQAGDNLVMCGQNAMYDLARYMPRYTVMPATDMGLWREKSGSELFEMRRLDTALDCQIQFALTPKRVTLGDDVYIGAGVLSYVPGQISMGSGARLNGSNAWRTTIGFNWKSVKLLVRDMKLSTRAQMTMIRPQEAPSPRDWAYPPVKYLGGLTIGYEASYIVRSKSFTVKQTFQDLLVPPGEIYME